MGRKQKRENGFKKILKILIVNLLGKRLYNNAIPGLYLFFVAGFILSCGKEIEMVTWNLDSVEEIAGHNIIVSGTPTVITTEEGEAVEFNGKSDGLLVPSNPIAGWENFIIEVDIKPYPGFPENLEQRFLHIQDPANEDRRILIELRLNENNEWYGDWFMKTENESLTLVDPTKTYPLNEWATISFRYEKGELTGLVNGEIQAQGDIKYLSSGSTAQTSIGTRMDQRSWFKGAIKEVRYISLDR